MRGEACVSYGDPSDGKKNVTIQFCVVSPSSVARVDSIRLWSGCEPSDKSTEDSIIICFCLQLW